MTQIASALAVATVLSAYGLEYLGREGVGLVRATKIPGMQEPLSQKCRGAYTRGGRNCGVLWYY